MTFLPFRRWGMFALFLLCGCGQQTPPRPAAVEKPRVESELARITLSAEAARSLKIRSEHLPPREVQDHKQLLGWIVPQQGLEVSLTAPVSGYVRAAAATPVPGKAVKGKETLLSLDPVLSPLETLQLAALKRGVENELAKAQESLQVAESELSRTEELVKQKLRGQQELEQAQARMRHAKEDLEAARDKLKLFPRKGEAKLAPVPIVPPRDGTLLVLHVSPGQFVAAAAPLATLIDLTSPWVRVAVAESDLSLLDLKAPASVWLRGPGPARPLEAKPLSYVPQVDPVKRTAEVLYELTPPADLTLAKDQVVYVHTPMRGKTRESVVPYSAVVFDAYAGAWVYLDRTGKEAREHVYERRRVELGVPRGDEIVIRPPLGENDVVVTEGAAALFSREFHKPPAPK